MFGSPVCRKVFFFILLLLCYIEKYLVDMYTGNYSVADLYRVMFGRHLDRRITGDVFIINYYLFVLYRGIFCKPEYRKLCSARII